jgi:hypothetical protein
MITKENIESALKQYSIPQDQCKEKAFEVAELLFGKVIARPSEKRLSDENEILNVIESAVTAGKIAIVWLDTGPVRREDVSYRALHCHFVFQCRPVMSFTVWATPGPEFIDEDTTRKKIQATLHVLGEVGVHVVP